MPTRGTPARKVRIDDPMWNAVQFVAGRRNADASEVIRRHLGDWIAREAAADPEVSANPAVRRYLAASRERPAQRQADDEPGAILALVLNERYPPAAA